MSTKPLAYPSLDISIQLESQTVSLDLRYLRDLYFIEDIFSFCMYGKLIFLDVTGIMENGPFTGNEMLNITYGSEGSNEKTFQIYRLNTYPLPNPAQDDVMFVVEIDFIDDVYIPLTQKQFSKSWKGQAYSDIVKDICTNMLNVQQFDYFEKTKEKADGEENPPYLMNYITPAQVIVDISSRSSNQEDAHGFLFFQNIKGYNFVTLETLLSRGRKAYGPAEDNMYIFKEENSYFTANKILDYRINGIDMDMLKLLKGGQRTGFDPKTKLHLSEFEEYSKALENVTILGEKSLYGDISDPNMSIMAPGDINKNVIKNRYLNEFVRNYNMQQFIEIAAAGHEERYAGELIDIRWPSFSKKEIYNKSSSGNYLIKSITHSFSPNQTPYYKQKIVCIKNGYHEMDSSLLVNAKKKNKDVLDYSIGLEG